MKIIFFFFKMHQTPPPPPPFSRLLISTRDFLFHRTSLLGFPRGIRAYTLANKSTSQVLRSQLLFISHLRLRNRLICYCYLKSGESQNLERRNVERLIFRNFKITNIKITKNELLNDFIFKFNFSFFSNHLNTQIIIIFQVVKY